MEKHFETVSDFVAVSAVSLRLPEPSLDILQVSITCFDVHLADRDINGDSGHLPIGFPAGLLHEMYIFSYGVLVGVPKTYFPCQDVTDRVIRNGQSKTRQVDDDYHLESRHEIVHHSGKGRDFLAVFGEYFIRPIHERESLLPVGFDVFLHFCEV